MWSLIQSMMNLIMSQYWTSLWYPVDSDLSNRFYSPSFSASGAWSSIRPPSHVRYREIPWNTHFAFSFFDLPLYASLDCSLICCHLFVSQQIKQRVVTLLNQHGGSMKDIRAIMRGKKEVFQRNVSQPEIRRLSNAGFEWIVAWPLDLNEFSFVSFSLFN